MSRSGLLTIPLVVAAVATVLGLTSAPPAHDARAIPVSDAIGIAKTATADLQAALVESGRCGTFDERVGPLVSEDDLGSIEKSLPRRVCLRNAGQVAGSVSIKVTALIDVEVECSATEEGVDATCGRRRSGELAQVIRQLIGLERGCTNAAATETSLRLLDLTSQPFVLLDVLRPGETMCVSLRVQHAPPDEVAGLRAQTDELRWTYVFDLTAE